MRRAPAAIALPFIACLIACESGAAGHDAGAGSEPASWPQPGLCERKGDDRVRDAFCGDEPPAIGSLQDLLTRFDLNPRDFDPESLDKLDKLDPERDVAVLGHSTALSGRLVSPINPRVILLGADVLLTFQRGVQRVELATLDRDTGLAVFYLLTFEQACNEADDGCSFGALYTEAIEQDWQKLELEDDEDLKNTPFDCRQCHQRNSEEPQLLMRELPPPWTHFLFPADFESGSPAENGSGLMLDYERAKGGERYGGIEVDKITLLGLLEMERIVGPAQPVLFDSSVIERERWPWTGDSGFLESALDSPTWESAYEAFKRGEQLALPYLELRATDPDKLAALTEAYRKYRDGEIEADDLPDLGDIYPDDPKLRARIGLETEPDATPAEALVQACGQCHNDVLDQSLSRARFSVALGRLKRAEIDAAIERIERPRDARGAMPPPEARQLAPDAREGLLEYLRGDLDEIDPMLERAAKLGMRNGGNLDSAIPDPDASEQF